jgi:phosphoglycolate phosphatase
MNKRYRLVVFDWEGTLSDTLGLIIDCIAKEAKRLKLGDLDKVLAYQSVELGLVNAVKKLFPALSLQEYERLLESIQACLLTRHAEVCLMPGAKEIINALHKKGVLLAIATNKGQQGLLRALQATELDSFFKVTRSAGNLPPKPCTQMLEEIFEECNVKPEEALMVGDSLSDIEMAKNMQTDVVGMDFYHKQADALKNAGALAVFSNFAALADFLKLKKDTCCE